MTSPGACDYRLVHANVARAKAPLDSPLMAEFVSLVDEINALARRAPGFVAQPTPPDDGAVFRAPLLLNVSIWESIEQATLSPTKERTRKLSNGEQSGLIRAARIQRM